jgi:N-acetylmuramoyl-L-alanine amidase
MPSNRDGNRRIAALLLPLFALVLRSQTTPAPVPTTPNSAPPQATQRPAPALILIDPAHGGADSGAALNAAIPEKDVTLVLARRLRQELNSRGLESQLLRDSDITLTADQRAANVNALRPALYIVIHASSQGSGMRLYTALLPAGQDGRGPFLDWQTAQASALTRSRSIQAQITASIQKTRFPMRSLTAPLRPLNNVTVAAVAMELAPTTGDVSQLASRDYQQMVCAALANGIASAAPLFRARLGSTQ